MKKCFRSTIEIFLLSLFLLPIEISSQEEAADFYQYELDKMVKIPNSPEAQAFQNEGNLLEEYKYN